MKMTVSQIADAARATILAAPCSAEELVKGLTWDSRTVTPGCLYVAFVGERVDGHDFVASAIADGARAALVTRDPGEAAVRAANDAGAAVLLVDDCEEALARLAAAWRYMQKGTVIGLTGSSGKTSSKNLVRDVLAARMSVVATQANQNNEIGVPNTLLAADDAQAVVVEMGMRGLGQIAKLCKVAHPDWGLVTNVGESHIELLGSRENIARAKAELFANLPDDGVAFVNAADERVEDLIRFGRLRERGVRTVFFDGYVNDRPALLDDPATADTPFVWASDITLNEQGQPSFTLNASNVPCVGAGTDADAKRAPAVTGQVPCKLELRGLHNVSNACSAAAVGLVAGMELQECADALAGAQPEAGRQQILHAANGALIVDDSYNANPDSMRVSLATFAAMEVEGRRIAVLGDMLELGDFSRECHERVGTYAAQAGLDLLICVGELSTALASSAVRCGMDPAAVICHADAAGALAELRGLVGPDDAVLVKASHSIGLQAVAEGLVA